MQEHGLLPLGVAPANGETTLFVATDNPTNTQPIAQLRANCRLPVKVLLAGPVDLAHALARVAESALEQPHAEIELAPPDMFDEMVPDEMYEQSQIDMMSALSMLADLPPDRHGADPPPRCPIPVGAMAAVRSDHTGGRACAWAAARCRLAALTWKACRARRSSVISGLFSRAFSSKLSVGPTSVSTPSRKIASRAE